MTQEAILCDRLKGDMAIFNQLSSNSGLLSEGHNPFLRAKHLAMRKYFSSLAARSTRSDDYSLFDFACPVFPSVVSGTGLAEKTVSVVYLQANWVTLAETESTELAMKDVTSIMSEIDDRLKDGQFALLDFEIGALTVSKMSPDAISAVARITVSANDKLNNWGAFIAAAEKVLAQKYPKSQALRGISRVAGGDQLSRRPNYRIGNKKVARRSEALWNHIRRRNRPLSSPSGT